MFRRIIGYFSTDCISEDRTLQADSCLVGQVTLPYSAFYETQSFHYSLHNSRPSIFILNQMNPVQTSISCFSLTILSSISKFPEAVCPYQKKNSGRTLHVRSLEHHHYLPNNVVAKLKGSITLMSGDRENLCRDVKICAAISRSLVSALSLVRLETLSDTDIRAVRLEKHCPTIVSWSTA
jgi:hypothetical protein